jgi:hypothetical protein
MAAPESSPLHAHALPRRRFWTPNLLPNVADTFRAVLEVVDAGSTNKATRQAALLLLSADTDPK